MTAPDCAMRCNDLAAALAGKLSELLPEMRWNYLTAWCVWHLQGAGSRWQVARDRQVGRWVSLSLAVRTNLWHVARWNFCGRRNVCLYITALVEPAAVQHGLCKLLGS
jgi:hypothetical protein